MRSSATMRGCATVVACAMVGLGASACNTGSQNARKNPQSVFSAINAIPSPAEASRWAVDPYDADLRQRGILLLANAPFGGERVYLDLYEVALRDPDSGVRLSAIRGLALHGLPEHAPMIVPFLKDGDRLVRWEAARALQRIHHPDAVRPLMDRLDPSVEAEMDVRAAAATALGQYAERRVAQALIASLRDPSLLVTHAAHGSLRTLTGQDQGDDPRVWTRWLADTQSPFVGQQAFEYPVFHRNRRWYEWVIPFYRPPNETPGTPVGMASATGPGATTDGEKAESTPENDRSR